MQQPVSNGHTWPNTTRPLALPPPPPLLTHTARVHPSSSPLVLPSSWSVSVSGREQVLALVLALVLVPVLVQVCWVLLQAW